MSLRAHGLSKISGKDGGSAIVMSRSQKDDTARPVKAVVGKPRRVCDMADVLVHAGANPDTGVARL